MSFYSIQVGTASISLEFSSLDSEIAASVFSARLTQTDVKAGIHYRIIKENDKWLLFRNNRMTHRNRQAPRIIYALEWQIVNDLIENNKATLKLHAAALVDRQNGYVFCGASSTGKTSLAIMLMRHGWRLLSDEFAILNIDRQITPFLRNLIIKPHLRAKVTIPDGSPVFRLYSENGEKSEAVYLSPLLLGSVCDSDSAKLGSLIFLEKSDKPGFDLQPIARYAALRLFMQNLLNPKLPGEVWIDFLVDTVNTCPVYNLKISSPLDLPLAEQRMLVERLIRIHQND